MGKKLLNRLIWKSGPGVWTLGFGLMLASVEVKPIQVGFKENPEYVDGFHYNWVGPSGISNKGLIDRPFEVLWYDLQSQIVFHYHSHSHMRRRAPWLKELKE